jgi:hypothetical protein
MGILEKLQNKGIEKIVKERVSKYAIESGVHVDLDKLEVNFYDHNYGVKIPFESDNEKKLRYFEKLLDKDPYLREHV